MDWTWITLALLGAYHGLNPAMGWLFAVALGMQERSRKAIFRALPAVAVGHEGALVVTLGILRAAEVVAAATLVQPLAAAGVIAFGLFKVFWPRWHPKWVGMRVGPKDLAVWSFLMSMAHGAGVMLLPVWLRVQPVAANEVHNHPAASFDISSISFGHDAAALTLHTASMLLVMVVVALLVYEKLGLAMLRKAWINQDVLWGLSLVTAGSLTLVII